MLLLLLLLLQLLLLLHVSRNEAASAAVIVNVRFSNAKLISRYGLALQTLSSSCVKEAMGMARRHAKLHTNTRSVNEERDKVVLMLQKLGVQIAIIVTKCVIQSTRPESI